MMTEREFSDGCRRELATRLGIRVETLAEKAARLEAERRKAGTESSSALLQRAADRLEELLDAMDDNRGPWYIANETSRPYPQSIRNIGVPYVVADTFTDPSHPPTAGQYICTMHPGVGRAMAQWLRTEAASTAGDEDHEAWHPETCTTVAAMATARRILGEA